MLIAKNERKHTSWAGGATVLLAWVTLVLVDRLSIDRSHSRKLSGDVDRRYSGVAVGRAVPGVGVVVRA